MNKVITEESHTSEKDCFYMVDREKEAFTYPLHKHEAMELNFVENCDGARRIVGDHEITIQFPPDLFNEQFLQRNQLSSIRALFQNAKRGIAFELNTIMELYEKIKAITQSQPGFYRMLKLMEILYELSMQENYTLLASRSFSNVKNTPESIRVRKVEEHIDQNFKQEIRLKTLSDIAGMTPAAFSRYFRMKTGKTVSDYIIDIRLGHAARQLIDTTNSVADICYDCGFNNISNFNRIFKKKKGCSPTAFRENYHKRRIIV